MTIWEQTTELRTSKWMSVSDLAKELWITRATLYRKEAWLYPFTLLEVIKMSDIFDTPIDTFVK